MPVLAQYGAAHTGSVLVPAGIGQVVLVPVSSGPVLVLQERLWGGCGVPVLVRYWYRHVLVQYWSCSCGYGAAVGCRYCPSMVLVQYWYQLVPVPAGIGQLVLVPACTGLVLIQQKQLWGSGGVPVLVPYWYQHLLVQYWSCGSGYGAAGTAGTGTCWYRAADTGPVLVLQKQLWGAGTGPVLVQYWYWSSRNSYGVAVGCRNWSSTGTSWYWSCTGPAVAAMGQLWGSCGVLVLSQYGEREGSGTVAVLVWYWYQ